jgi:hypothetical protein
MTRDEVILASVLLACGLLTASCGGGSAGEPKPSSSSPSSSSMFPAPHPCDESARLVDLRDPKPVDGTDGVSYRVLTENSGGQVFALTFTGPSRRVVIDDIDRTKVCFEAQRSEATLETETPPPLLEDIVIDAIVEASGKSREELSQKRDGNLASAPTLETIAQELGMELAPVVDKAIADATASFPDIDPTSIEHAVKDILEQPYAPMLAGAAEEPDTPAGYAKLLEDSNTIILEVDLVDPNLPPPTDPEVDSLIAVSYAIDPRVNLVASPTRRYYRAKCQVHAAYVRLHAKAGRMEAHLWQKSPHRSIGHEYASATWTPDPPALWHSSGPPRSYDIYVRGWQDGSSYRLDGAWTLGSPGTC